MSKVNGDVQEVIDTTDYIINALMAIWQSFPIEMKMYIAVMFTISILLQQLKKGIFANYPKQKRIKKLWFWSLPLGITVAIAASFIYEGLMHYGWFVFAGATASSVSMGVHRISVDFIWPIIKRLKNVRLTIKEPTND